MDPYEDMKAQYRTLTRSAEPTDRVARLAQLRSQLRAFCIANGGDLQALDGWLASELDEWAGYGGG